MLVGVRIEVMEQKPGSHMEAGELRAVSWHSAGWKAACGSSLLHTAFRR